MKKENSILRRVFEHKYFTLVLVLILIFIVFGIITGGIMFNPINIRNILNLTTITAILTCGQACVMITGEIDLSCGAVGTCGGVALGWAVTNWGLPWWVGILFGCVVGLAFGAVNALLVNQFKMESFISGIALYSVAKGLGYTFAGSIGIALTDSVLKTIGSAKIGKAIPVSVIISIAIFIIYGIILSTTKIGRKMFILGGNRTATRLVGLNPTRISYFAFMNCGLCSALAGMMYACRVFNATATGISSEQFIGVECCMLGGIMFGGGSGGMVGAFLGMMIINVFNNGLSLTGVDPYWQVACSGIILVAAMLIDFLNKKRQNKLMIAKMNAER